MTPPIAIICLESSAILEPLRAISIRTCDAATKAQNQDQQSSSQQLTGPLETHPKTYLQLPVETVSRSFSHGPQFGAFGRLHGSQHTWLLLQWEAGLSVNRISENVL